MSRTVPVGLGARAYDVVIGRGLLETSGERIAPLLKRRRIAVAADASAWARQGPRLAASLAAAGIDAPVIEIPSGEASKSFAGLEQLLDRLLALELERGDLVLAFGGGVTGDLAGFAAAIYKRGIDFIQVPTTLLAQVDSSVGGKTAVDSPRGKNLIGAFHQPRLVLADLDALSSLPARDVACGYAEIVKYGLLGDAAFFTWLETEGAGVTALEPAALEHAVARSVEMKAEVVAEDEREAGRRALLNLGHTFGHAFEAETGFAGELLHGEAVALGCALAFRYAAMIGLVDGATAGRAAAPFAAAGLPTRISDIGGGPFAADDLVAHMRQDKKAEGGAVTLILPRAIGETFVARRADTAALRQFLIQEGASP